MPEICNKPSKTECQTNFEKILKKLGFGFGKLSRKSVEALGIFFKKSAEFREN